MTSEFTAKITARGFELFTDPDDAWIWFHVIVPNSDVRIIAINSNNIDASLNGTGAYISRIHSGHATAIPECAVRFNDPNQVVNENMVFAQIDEWTAKGPEWLLIRLAMAEVP